MNAALAALRALAGRMRSRDAAASSRRRRAWAAPDLPLVLVSCSDTKRETGDVPAPASTVYIMSPLFRASLAYARTLVPDDRIRIVSALHGAIGVDERITSYDFRLQNMSKSEREAWGSRTVGDLVSDFGRGPLRVVVLAGETYVDALAYGVGYHGLRWALVRPLARLKIGERVRWLNERVAEAGVSPFETTHEERVEGLAAYLGTRATEEARSRHHSPEEGARIAEVLRNAGTEITRRKLGPHEAIAYLDELGDLGTRYFEEDGPHAERYRDLALSGNALPTAIRGIERGRHLTSLRAARTGASPEASV